jgi:hypothetical protein
MILDVDIGHFAPFKFCSLQWHDNFVVIMAEAIKRLPVIKVVVLGGTGAQGLSVVEGESLKMPTWDNESSDSYHSIGPSRPIQGLRPNKKYSDIQGC